MSNVKNHKINQTFNLENVEIFAVGIWNGDKYTAANLDAMIQAFDEIGFRPPLKIGHNDEQELKDGQPAIGWVDRIYRVNDKLLADFNSLPPKVFEAIKQGSYKNISSEIFIDFKSQDKTHPFVLKAVALLGADIPAVTNLEELDGLFEDNKNTCKSYECTNLKIYTQEVHKDMSKDTKGMDDLALIDTSANTIKQYQQDKEDAAKALLKSEGEKADLKKQVESYAQKTDALIYKDRQNDADKFITAKIHSGQIIPAAEKQFAALYAALDDTIMVKFSMGDKEVELTQKGLLEGAINALPVRVDFEEISVVGAGEKKAFSNAADAGIEVDRLASQYMIEHPTVDYGAALNFVLDSNHDLKKQYEGVK